MADQKRSRLPLIAAVVVVVVAAAIGGFFYLTRDTSDPELKLSDSKSGTGEVVAADSLDGSWKVAAGTGDDATVAGYRVKEVFAAGSRKVTANGRTNDVTGTLTVAGDQVTAGEFTVDMTTLKSDEDRRDGAIKGRGLETDRFEDGTFKLTEPIALPTIKDGDTFDVKATGELTLHGVTKPVTIDLTARSADGVFTVQGSAPVEMADYDIEAPSVGGFVEVQDNGSFEFIVNFEKA
ncbi:YceI family protein [Aquihabitans sp. G128]|uniref:YceI family protein n=1 Tax=Aquihabitans sp. G128 TaxID=2849779 RepID=UPI001C226492|nr:YceI family protein [Aquihabitans sp. G128]QXC59866.1 YceI family protein [Aquihabitans sp. G128]